MNKDIMFLKMAKTAAEFSKCSSRQIGAIIVQNGAIVSAGYNGAPKGVDMCQNPMMPCMRREMGYKSGEGLEVCPAVHAEMNAIVQAALNGSRIDGSTMYAYCVLPCKWCMSLIINAGIKKVVCLKGQDYDALSRKLAESAGIEIVQYEEANVDSNQLYVGCPTAEHAYATFSYGCNSNCTLCWEEYQCATR